MAISKDLSTTAFLLSLASKLPTLISTASREFTSCLMVIEKVNFPPKQFSINESDLYPSKKNINFCFPFSDVTKLKLPLASVDTPS